MVVPLMVTPLVVVPLNGGDVDDSPKDDGSPDGSSSADGSPKAGVPQVNDGVQEGDGSEEQEQLRLKENKKKNNLASLVWLVVFHLLVVVPLLLVDLGVGKHSSKNTVLCYFTPVKQVLLEVFVNEMTTIDLQMATIGLLLNFVNV